MRSPSHIVAGLCASLAVLVTTPARSAEPEPRVERLRHYLHAFSDIESHARTRNGIIGTGFGATFVLAGAVLLNDDEESDALGDAIGVSFAAAGAVILLGGIFQLLGSGDLTSLSESYEFTLSSGSDADHADAVTRFEASLGRAVGDYRSEREINGTIESILGGLGLIATTVLVADRGHLEVDSVLFYGVSAGILATGLYDLLVYRTPPEDLWRLYQSGVDR